MELISCSRRVSHGYRQYYVVQSNKALCLFPADVINSKHQARAAPKIRWVFSEVPLIRHTHTPRVP